MARKIYRDLAIYDNATNVTHGVRRIGRQVSLFVLVVILTTTLQVIAVRIMVESLSNNSNETTKSYYDPHDSEDATTNHVGSAIYHFLLCWKKENLGLVNPPTQL